AGGFGLTLTEADYVFLMDPWWNPAAESQAIDRVHRIGQEASVLVYRMVAAGTSEEKVLDLQRRKTALTDALWGDGQDGFAQALTADEIRGLLEGSGAGRPHDPRRRVLALLPVERGGVRGGGGADQSWPRRRAAHPRPKRGLEGPGRRGAADGSGRRCGSRRRNQRSRGRRPAAARMGGRGP